MDDVYAKSQIDNSVSVNADECPFVVADIDPGI